MAYWWVRPTLAAAAAAAMLPACNGAQLLDAASAAHLLTVDARFGDHVLTVATLDSRTLVVLSDDHAYAMTFNSALHEIDLRQADRGSREPSRFFRIDLNDNNTLIYTAEWSTPLGPLGGASAAASASGG